MHYRSIYKQQRPEHKPRYGTDKRHRGSHKRFRGMYKRHRRMHKRYRGTLKRHRGMLKRHHRTYKCLLRKQIEILESGIKESLCFNRVFFDAKRNQLSSTYAPVRKKVIFHKEDITLKKLKLLGRIPRSYSQKRESIKSFHHSINPNESKIDLNMSLFSA